MRLRALICLGLVAAVSVIAVPSAIGQNPTDQQYGDELTNITSRTDPGGGGSSGGVLEKRVVSPLPFTGLDVVSLSAVAMALLGTGLVVRRLSAARNARS